MGKLRIGEHDVDVPDTFPDMSPEEQKRTVDEIASRLPSRTNAFIGGALNAATFNFRDELHGLGRAGGLDPNDPNPVNAAIALGKGAYRKATGDPEAERLYQEQATASREQTKKLEKDYPGWSLAGNVAGSAAVPFGMAARGATWAGRAIGAGVGGGIVGGVSGFGSGEGLPSSIKHAAFGAPVGAGVGAVASPITELAVRGAGALVEPVARTVRGWRNPTQEAERRIGGAYERDRLAGDVGLTPAELSAEVARGTPAVVADTGGETVRALARSAANTSPEARAALTRTTQERYQDTGTRVSDYLRGQYNHPDAFARQEALDVAERVANSAAYRKARAEGPSVWSPELERLTGSNEVIGAMQSAQKKANSRAVVEGEHYSPLNSNAYVDEAGQLTIRKRDGTPTYPDLRFWDYTRRELSQASRAAYRSGHNDDGARLKGLADLMNTELDKIVPSYGEARRGAAGFFGAENALEAGQNFVGAAQRFGIPETQRALARMTPEQRALFQDGYVSRFTDALEAKGRAARTTLLNNIQSSRPAQQELRMALGQDGADRLLARLRVEGIMDRMRGALQNSTSVRQLVELGLAGSGAGLTGFDPFNLGHYGTSAGIGALLVAGGSRFGRGVDQQVARRVGDMLSSHDHTIVERGIEMVARNDTLRNAVNGADNLMSRVLGQGAPEQAGRAAGLDEPSVPAVGR